MQAVKQIAKINKAISKHFAEWVAMPYSFDAFHDDPIGVFQAVLDGDSRRAAISSASEELATWHFSIYSNSVLNAGEYNTTAFANSARYGHAQIKFEEAFANSRGNGSVLLWVAARTLSLNILAGWKDETGSIGMTIYRGLDTLLLDLRQSEQHGKGSLYRHFWFLLHMYCQLRNLPLVSSMYSYPDDMSPYATALADWRTTDPDKVQRFVTAMADFHLEQARPTKHDEIAEFDTEDRMLFPYEILSFLRLREWLGLPNPERFEHPLMQHPLAHMPFPVPLPQPETPLLDAVVAKFRTEFPGSFED